LFVKTLVNLGDFCHPLLAFWVFQSQNVFRLPVKVVGDIGYLLIKPFEGVAPYSPKLVSSTSNSFSQ
jgi:hypothetical protein